MCANHSQHSQNCVSVVRELPLNIWTPTSDDLSHAHQWLVGTPIQSQPNKLARVLLGELNWGRSTDVSIARNFAGENLRILRCCLHQEFKFFPQTFCAYKGRVHNYRLICKKFSQVFAHYRQIAKIFTCKSFGKLYVYTL